MPKRSRAVDDGDQRISQTAGKSKRRTLPRTSNSFTDFLRKAGFFVGEGNNANELDVDQAKFIQELEKHLPSEETVDSFVSGLQTLLEDEVRFKWSLLPTVTSATCKNARNDRQDSLMHLLLNVECLQERVARILLQKLADFSFCDTNDIFDPAEGQSLACMILSQFRWLSKLVNGTDLAEELLELVRGTPTEVQRDIISLLPEIVAVSDHGAVANALAEILLQQKDLNVAILTALCSLDVDEETSSSVREQVLKTLATANVEDLPGIARFVLTNLKLADIEDTINEIRNNLDFTPAFDPVLASTPITGPEQKGGRSNSCLFIDAIKHSIQFHKAICDVWIRVLNSVHSPACYNALDVIMFFVLHSLGPYEKKVETLVKRKIKSGELNEEILNTTFKHHHNVLKEYTRTLLSLAEVLLKSNESAVLSYGCLLYTKAFSYFDTHARQDIVANLVTHAGSGTVFEMNAALSALLSLVKTHTTNMAPFGIFVKNLLDSFDQLTLVQIRKVYQILSYLTYQGGQEGRMMEDDMHIIMRKQLMNSNVRYCKVGVIGALVTMRTLCRKPESGSVVSDSEEQGEKVQENVIPLLKLVWQSTLNRPDALALFCDELCRILMAEKSVSVIENWVDENILGNFEAWYTLDINACCGGRPPCRDARYMFCLDEVDDPVALNLYGSLEDSKTVYRVQRLDSDEFSSSQTVQETGCHSKKKVQSTNVDAVFQQLLNFASKTPDGAATSSSSTGSVSALASVFRLLRIRTQSQDPTLEAIDGLLGCAILMPDVKTFAALTENKKHFILDATFYCINWIRENINAFVSIENEEIKMNVLLRLQLLIELQEIMFKHLEATEKYMPPIVNFDLEASDVKCPKLATQKQGKAKKKKDTNRKNVKVSKKQNRSAASMDDSMEISSSDDQQTSLTKNMEIYTVFMNSLHPFFREFDIEVFVLFRLGVTFKKLGSAYAGDKQREMALHPLELKFLLEDLLLKTRHVLQVNTGIKLSHQPVGHTNLELHTAEEIVIFCIGLFPALCHILEECANYFRYLTTENDSSGEASLLLSESSLAISYVMQLIFKLIDSIMGWKQFGLSDNQPLLKKALRTVASQEAAPRDHAPLQECINLSVEYLAKFDDAVITLSSCSSLMSLLETIVSYSKDSSPKQQVYRIARSFLRKRWVELHKRNIKPVHANSNISMVLSAFLKQSENVLEALDFLTKEAIAEFANPTRDEDRELFGTLKKSTLSVYYRIMFSSLTSEMKLFYEKKRTQSEELKQWALAIRIFQSLVNLIKTFDSRPIIAVSLKHCQLFVSIFLKHGMPFLDKLFSNHRDQSLLLLKNLQTGTRYMQHVCLHSKALKDVSLTRQVPFLKRTLERFIYRVKTMLAVNKCHEAYWIGNLKNRDLKGTEILSQQLNESDSESTRNSESDNESLGSVNTDQEDD